MIIRVMKPTMTIEFRDSRDNVICVAKSVRDEAMLTIDPDDGSVTVPCCMLATVVERGRDHVRFESVFRDVNDLPCGTTSVLIEAPLVGIVLMHFGIDVADER